MLKLLYFPFWHQLVKCCMNTDILVLVRAKRLLALLSLPAIPNYTIYFLLLTRWPIVNTIFSPSFASFLFHFILVFSCSPAQQFYLAPEFILYFCYVFVFPEYKIWVHLHSEREVTSKYRMNCICHNAIVIIWPKERYSGFYCSNNIIHWNHTAGMIDDRWFFLVSDSILH